MTFIDQLKKLGAEAGPDTLEGALTTAKLVRLLLSNTQAIIELVEAADKLDSGHHALCNAPLNQWCSCGLTDLKTALSKLKGDV
jgi:hypothetical protein